MIKEHSGYMWLNQAVTLNIAENLSRERKPRSQDGFDRLSLTLYLLNPACSIQDYHAILEALAKGSTGY